MEEKVLVTIPNVPKDLLKKAQTIARKEDRPLAQVVRELLRTYVAENQDKLKK